MTNQAAPAMTLETAILITGGFAAKFGSPRFVAISAALAAYGLEPERSEFSRGRFSCVAIRTAERLGWASEQAARALMAANGY